VPEVAAEEPKELLGQETTALAVMTDEAKETDETEQPEEPEKNEESDNSDESAE
jgi:hypothetical protein